MHRHPGVLSCVCSHRPRPRVVDNARDQEMSSLSRRCFPIIIHATSRRLLSRTRLLGGPLTEHVAICGGHCPSHDIPTALVIHVASPPSPAALVDRTEDSGIKQNVSVTPADCIIPMSLSDDARHRCGVTPRHLSSTHRHPGVLSCVCPHRPQPRVVDNARDPEMLSFVESVL